MSVIDAATVLMLARAQGYEWLSPDDAARIAAGAVDAIAAVRAALRDQGFESFDTDHAAFLAVLESLAEPPT